MTKYIKFGAFNEKHKYVVFSIIYLILRDAIFGYNYNESFHEIIPKGSFGNFSKFTITTRIFSYLITVIVSLVLFYYETGYDPIQNRGRKLSAISRTVSKGNNNG